MTLPSTAASAGALRTRYLIACKTDVKSQRTNKGIILPIILNDLYWQWHPRTAFILFACICILKRECQGKVYWFFNTRLPNALVAQGGPGCYTATRLNLLFDQNMQTFYYLLKPSKYLCSSNHCENNLFFHKSWDYIRVDNSRWDWWHQVITYSSFSSSTG